MQILPVSAQPRQSLVPGGIAIVQLITDETIGFRFNGKSVLTTWIDGAPSAVVGLPLDLKPGEHYIEKIDSDSIQKKFFEVGHKHYTTQYITIENKRKVNPKVEVTTGRFSTSAASSTSSPPFRPLVVT